jgi:hypothetical protein
VRHRSHSFSFVALIVLVTACRADGDASDETSSEGHAGSDDGQVHAIPVDVVVPELWLPDLASDPIPTHQPPDIDCSIGFKDEFGVFEVDTGLCNYGVFVQPSLTDVGAGERIELVVTHDDLIAPEPAQGHVAMAIGGRVNYEIYLDIPKPYGLVQGEWITDVAIPAGTPVALHVHNHGYNSWRLVSLKASTP